MAVEKHPTDPMFQSTPPMRRATMMTSSEFAILTCFNPRPPCGGRLNARKYDVFLGMFQSTPPMRRATLVRRWLCITVDVSIHAPHAEGDI